MSRTVKLAKMIAFKRSMLSMEFELTAKLPVMDMGYTWADVPIDEIEDQLYADLKSESKRDAERSRVGARK